MKNLCAILTFFCLTNMVSAQDFMMQAWYWDYPKTCEGYNWADTLNDKVGDLAGNFTYLWLPPLSNASFGSCSNGYDPRDLYDLGEFNGATGFGTRSDLDALIGSLNSNGISPVADVVYNHRDGGAAEQNDPVRDYITNHYTSDKNPFPSDRFRCVIPLGGASGNGAGDYYFKINSKTGHSNFYNKEYKVYMNTNTVGWQGQADGSETEPNCSQTCDPSGCGGVTASADSIILGRNFVANIDAAACNTDEFHLHLDASDFDAAGDFLYIYLSNTNGDYSDHRIWGIWRHNDGEPNGGDITSQLIYQTYTDFTGMPSGQGGMNYENFRPNSTNTSTTYLQGDWDWLWFFYDVDQDQASTQSIYLDWTKWLWTDVGIRGYRMDAVKHFPPGFVGTLLNGLATSSPSINPGMVVGEFFDSDPFTLKNWVSNVQSNMGNSSAQVRAFDFSLRQALKNSCDAFGYDVRNVFTSGMVDGASASPFNSVTFVNNHDFRDAGQPVQNDPMLAYAYILTNNQVGLPCVFYPEYFGKTVPHYPTVNLKTQIDELIQVHKDYIFSSNSRSYLSKNGSGYSSSYSSGGETTTLFYQLKDGVGGKDVLVVINFAGTTLSFDHTVDGSNFPIGTTFNRVAGTSTNSSFTVQSGYWVNIEVPARSYAVFAESAILPVDLVDFQAKAEKNRVRLDWRSLSEKEFSGYQVERSLDGEKFEPLMWVPKKGSETTAADYLHFDQNPPLGETIYYRLRMENEDGSFSHSPIRSVRLEEPWVAPVFVPNPTSGNSVLSFQSPIEAEVGLLLFDAMGRQVLMKNFPATAGQNMLELEMGNLPEGVYFAQLVSGGEVKWRERVVKI